MLAKELPTVEAINKSSILPEVLKDDDAFNLVVEGKPFVLQGRNLPPNFDNSINALEIPPLPNKKYSTPEDILRFINRLTALKESDEDEERKARKEKSLREELNTRSWLYYNPDEYECIINDGDKNRPDSYSFEYTTHAGETIYLIKKSTQFDSESL